MEIFLFVLAILIILAVSDLIVGVGNDAVNFLNSAFGSKVAPRHIIILIASVGIIAGTLFSSGMMEVARKGIFNPQHFYFEEIMTIFLAVMLTDVILLDFFNTFGMPTSTTVSIVFELLGAAIAVSLIKISANSQDLSALITYINTSKAIAIISGILLSIVVAFTVGAIVQFITRLVFTFDYKKKIARYGAIFAGISFSAITFFILIKGAKSASFMTADIKGWIYTNTISILAVSFIVWTILFQILLFFKINIFKIIVLVGTFALALAFAANDLVNFIGVPLAGLHSYQIANHSDNIAKLLMSDLQGKIHSDPWLLVFAGLVMIGTLYFNKKARGVIKTSLDLGRQGEGEERFGTSIFARSVVRIGISLGRSVNAVLPKSVSKGIQNRFKNAQNKPLDEDGQEISFDLIRASVNLMVASVLISIATSWKLPLSTTYVTFMVAMGTSFSDKAWGRDSAVYRINGVITVIGGWFFTALIASTIAGIFATIIYFGSITAIVLLSLLALYFVIRSHKSYNKEKLEEEALEDETIQINKEDIATSALDKIIKRYTTMMNSMSTQLISTFNAFASFDRNEIKNNRDFNKKIKKISNKIVSNIVYIVRNLPESEVKKGRRYGKLMGATQEIAMNYRTMVDKMYEHINNNHRPLLNEQNERLIELKGALVIQINAAENFLLDHSKYDEFVSATNSLNEKMITQDEANISLLRLNDEKYSTRGNMLYMDIVSSIDNISSQVYHLITVLNKNFINLELEK